MEKSNPISSGLGATELSLKVLHPLSIHMSICAMEAFKWARLRLNIWAQLPEGGKE